MPAHRPLPALVATPVLALLLACGLPPPGVAAAGQLPTGPAAGDVEVSPFYRWSEALPAKPGTELRRAPMTAQREMPASGEPFRILYTSTEARWGSGPDPCEAGRSIPVQ